MYVYITPHCVGFLLNASPPLSCRSLQAFHQYLAIVIQLVVACKLLFFSFTITRFKLFDVHFLSLGGSRYACNARVCIVRGTAVCCRLVRDRHNRCAISWLCASAFCFVACALYSLHLTNQWSIVAGKNREPKRDVYLPVGCGPNLTHEL